MGNSGEKMRIETNDARRRDLFRSQRATPVTLILCNALQSGFWYCCNSDRVPDGVEHFD